MHRTKFIHKSWQISRHRLRSIKQRYKYQPQVHNTTNKMYIHSEAINTQTHTETVRQKLSRITKHFLQVEKLLMQIPTPSNDMGGAFSDGRCLRH